jgi:type IV pilus assembly protein PilN
MSARINLLPHREERRKRARTHFAVLSGFTAVLGLVIVGAVWFVNDQRVTVQNDRNAFMKGEIAKLDKEIDEIKKLRDEIAALLARKQVIETLESAQWLASPGLVEIKASTVDKKRVSEFNLNFSLKRTAAEEAKGAAKAAKKG